MKKTLIAILAAFAVSVFADNAELRFVSKGGAKTVKTVALRKTADGAERLEIPMRDIPFDCKYIDVVHEFAKAKKGDAGYWVFSTGAMGTFRLDDDRMVQRNQVMPLFGFKTDKKTVAAIAKGLKYEYSTIVEAKKGNYEIYQRYEIEKMGYTPYEDIIVDFYTLTGEDADYSGMARKYRQFQLESGTVRPIRERMKTNPYLEYAAAAPEIRVRQAWKPVPSPVEEQTLANEPKVTPYVTFDRVGEIMDMLKAKGVEKAEFCLVGWNVGGHDGRYPQMFPVEPALGGEAKLRALIKKAQDMGYQIVCHTNSTDCYNIADTFSENIVAKNFDGSRQKNASWGGGRMYNMCAQVSWDIYAQPDLTRVRELGFEGLHYIDVISCVPPRNCFDQKHPTNRRQFAEYMNNIMKFAGEKFGGAASEGGFDYIAGNLDYALYVSFNLMKKHPKAVDRITPLWQIVYNGIILSNPSAETTNYIIKDAKTRLKLVEFGGRPMFYYHSAFRKGSNWMGDTDLRCQTQEEFEQSGEAIKKSWDEFSKLKHLQLEFMDSHNEIAKDVFVTRYSNGDEIVSNYSDKDFSYRGKTVRPMAYEFIAKKSGWFFGLF